MVEVYPAGPFLGLFAEASRKRRARKYGPYRCRGCPAESKPPVAVSVRISTGERRSFGATAPLSTRASSLKRRAGGSAVMPKQVELVEPLPTFLAEELSPFITRPATASSVRLRVLVSGVTSASMTRRGC